MFRTSDDFKPHVQVELRRLLVLLVHVERGGAERGDRVGQQPPPSALAARRWVQEQHLDLAVHDGDETSHLAALVAHAG
jgi:hypothetical protein